MNVVVLAFAFAMPELLTYNDYWLSVIIVAAPTKNAASPKPVTTRSTMSHEYACTTP